MPSEVKRLTQLEEENRRLKEMVADLSMADARIKCEAFRRDYNYERPHGSIGKPSQPMAP